MKQNSIHIEPVLLFNLGDYRWINEILIQKQGTM